MIIPSENGLEMKLHHLYCSELGEKKIPPGMGIFFIDDTKDLLEILKAVKEG